MSTLTAFSDPVYMERPTYLRLSKEGLINKGPKDPKFVEELERDGLVFTDVEKVKDMYLMLDGSMSFSFFFFFLNFALTMSCPILFK